MGRDSTGDNTSSAAAPHSSDGADWDILADRAHSRRFPRIPDRDEVAADELPDWEVFQQRFEKVRRDKHNLTYRHRIAGGFFGLMCSPPLASALSNAGSKVAVQQGRPGSYTAADHEFIDLILSFDSGHWGLLANHVPFAIASGIPTDTVRAIRDHRESDLSPADQQVIAFIRATRDGTMSDDLWAGMVERLGSERGAVELVFMTLTLLTHLRLNQVFDEVQIQPDELEDLLVALDNREYPLPDVIHSGPPETRPVPARPALTRPGQPR